MNPYTRGGTENQMRWDRVHAPFMEVWYATMNDPQSGLGLWFRYTITAPEPGVGAPHCDLWAFAFDPDKNRTFAGKERIAIDHLGSANGRDDGALVRLGSAWLSENHMEGEVRRDARAVRWSLDWNPAEACFHHLPPVLRDRIAKRVSTVCSPNLDVRFTGRVEIDGEVLDLSGARGCQSHRWGTRHSRSWAWAHCGGFDEDEDAVFEGVAAQPEVARIPGPLVTFVYLRWGGNDLAFNDLRGSLRARSRYDLPTWAFTATNEAWKIAGAARLAPAASVQVEYVDPDGSSRHCVNSEVADLAIEVYRRDEARWRHVGSLTRLGRAHLEFGRREPFVEVPVARL